MTGPSVNGATLAVSMKRWNDRPFDADAAGLFMRELGMQRPTAQVLASRGMRSLDEARKFIAPDLADLHNPFLMPDISSAVSRIRRALDAGEKILVYGDRDVDGVTALSVMIRTLRALGARPFWYIPSDEGYGLHRPVIDRFAAEGVTLIITVDCGISAAPEVDYCSEHGIDVVVTDHHEPPATGIPRAAAVVDPKRSDAVYPFKDLAGCAVAFKVAEALMLSFGRWYNRPLIFAAVDSAGQLTAVVDKNGIALGRFGPDAQPVTDPALAAFVRSGVVITEQASPALALMEQLFGAALTGPSVLVPGPAPDASALQKMFYTRDRENDLRMHFFRQGHLDAVGLGTIADMVPLSGENRVLAWHGIEALGRSSKPGITVLLERCQAKGKSNAPVTAKTISWSVTPLVNAAGRRGKADRAAELLLTDSVTRAHDLMDELEKLNAERRQLQAENLEKFVPLLEQQCDVANDQIFVVTATGLEHGVTGIIASQIVRTYGRPAVLLIIEGAEAMGAARSIEGFDMVGALNRVSDILVKFGGHTQAAGLTVSVDNIPELRQRLREIAAAEISSEQMAGSLDIDAALDPADVSLALVRDLARLEPFGTGNPSPVFSVAGVQVREKNLVGATGGHLKLKVAGPAGAPLSAIAWNWGDRADRFPADRPLSLAVQLETNVWQDRQTVQLLIHDVKETES